MTFKQRLRMTRGFIYYKSIQDRKEYFRWRLSGHPLPPPHLLKQRTVLEYSRRFRLSTFIETGTYLGDMVAAVHRSFKRVYSVELSPELAENARKRFRRFPAVTVVQGDSTQVLGKILRMIDEPCLFWLDGHFSGGVTAFGEKETPICEELKWIINHWRSSEHVILIDDARCFTGIGDYPTTDMLKDWLAGFGYTNFEVHQDIVRIVGRRHDA